MLYEKLQDIRDSTWDAFLACGYSVKPVLSLPETMSFAPVVQLIGQTIYIHAREDLHAELYDPSGRKLPYRMEKISPDEIRIIPGIKTPSVVLLVLSGSQQPFASLLFWGGSW